MKYLGIFSGLALAAAVSAYAETVPSQAIGTVGVGTDWEATVYAAYDERQFFPFRGCLSSKDKNAYNNALEDKASRDRLQQDFDAIVQPAGSPFRQLLSHVADPNTQLKSVINGALLDTLSGPRHVYWPGISWNDKGKYGEVGFEPCDEKSFRVERKLTRVIRTQTVDSLTQTTEPLTANGQPAPVTLKIFTLQLTVAAPDETPGTVQLLGNGQKRYCFTAQDAQGNALKSFAAYTPASDGYQVRFPELTKQLKSDLALVKELSPFYHYAGNRVLPTAKKDAYSEHYAARVEQDDLGIQIGLCGKQDVPYQTDKQEYLYLSGL